MVLYLIHYFYSNYYYFVLTHHLVYELFGRNVPYEDIRFFELKSSFFLTDEEFEQMMIKAHTPEVFLSYEETPEAAKTVSEWIEEGHEVYVITGRPYSAYEASREWLDRHGLKKAELFCLDKYGRDNFIKNSRFNLTLKDYREMHFDYAVEDSPLAFKFFEHLPELKVMVYDRPWNRECVFPGKNYQRCFDWDMIRKKVGNLSDNTKYKRLME